MRRIARKLLLAGLLLVAQVAVAPAQERGAGPDGGTVIVNPAPNAWRHPPRHRRDVKRRVPIVQGSTPSLAPGGFVPESGGLSPSPGGFAVGPGGFSTGPGGFSPGSGGLGALPR